MTLRELLNKIQWDRRQNPTEYEVTFIHRGASSDMRTIEFAAISVIGPSWFTYRDGDEVLIPYHRVLTVRNTRTGRVVWGKRCHGTAVR